MNPARKRPLAGKFERRPRRPLEIEGRIQGRHLVGGIREGNVTRAPAVILLTPAPHLTAESVEFFLLLTDDILEFLHGCHALIHPVAARIRRR